MGAPRITGGTARSRLLRAEVPGGVRPTPARVREALFSMLGDVDGQSFLDAFGGAGIVALEAWSRGAVVTVVERNRRALAALKSNVADLQADVTVRPGDALRLDPTDGPFDVVFADPPYADDPAPVLERLAPLTGDVLVYQAARKVDLPEAVGDLVLVRDRRYGQTRLWLYERHDPG